MTATGLPPKAASTAGSLFTRRRIVTSVILAGALALLVWGLSNTRPTATPITYTDPAVQSLEPEPGVLALRQERIGVTLKANYTLAQATASGITINNTGIPQDQIQVLAGLNQYSFTPGPGKEISSLPPGRNCASILIRLASDPSDTGHRYAWCFNSQ